MKPPLKSRIDPDEILIKAMDKVLFEEGLGDKEYYCAKVDLRTILAWYVTYKKPKETQKSRRYFG